ncbi:MAG: S1C family serine protease [Geminicoccaceae bacterium]
MAQDEDEIPAVARPRAEDVDYDLASALSSVVAVRAEVPPDSFTASILGTEREGSGVVIDASGLVLTIGYLITEAERVWITSAGHGAAAGHVVAYDQATGFGLVQPMTRLRIPPLPMGSATEVEVGTEVVVAAGRGPKDALSARIAGRRPFAGYWEYYLDDALFTAPAHPHWGGAACISPKGRLVGIGSLLVQEASSGGEGSVGNMIVPIDHLAPVLEDLLLYGRQNRPPRPWLGLYAADANEGVVVTGVAPGGPAAAAGLAEGDILASFGGSRIDDLADLWQRLWAAGEAGVKVSVTLIRNGRPHEFNFSTADRQSFLRQPRLH